MDRPRVVLDGYEIGRLLGAGAVARVYLAREVALDRLVALKLLSVRGTAARTRFARGAHALARIQHANVVALHHAELGGSHPHLVLELVTGPRLDQLATPMRWPRAAHIALGLAEALTAVHQRGVRHHDVKPGNVMLTDDGDVKLVDFGCAAVVAHRARVGTPHYMAPELLRGEASSVASELYAFGLLVHELVAGRYAGAPEALSDLIQRCIAREPGDRPSSAAEVRDALVAIVRSHETERGISLADDEDPVPRDPRILDALPTETAPFSDHRPRARLG
jgi:serine/threonine protein kinase